MKILIAFILSSFLCIPLSSANAKDVNPFGKKYIVSTELNNGDHYKQSWSFSNDGKSMDVNIFEGPHVGLKDSLVLMNMEVSPGVWMINWLALNPNAAKGNTISYVVDFKKGKVWGFFTNNPRVTGEARPYETATGTIVAAH